MFTVSKFIPSALGRLALLIALLLAAGLAVTQAAQADTLDRIRTSGKLTLGFRDDARPFSFKDEAGKPAGFSISLCERIVDDLKTSQNLSNLTVEWVPVTADERTAALQQGRIDILCGADSVSLQRREELSFSIPIYPGGIGAIASANSPVALRDILEGRPATGPVWRGSPARILNQRTFVVVAGSTAESWLAERIQHFQLDAKTITVEHYADGVKSLTDGIADVFFGDRAIIMETAAQALDSGTVVALNRMFTHAPIALTIARDNDALRLVIDRSLSRMFETPDFRETFVKWFGAGDAATLLFYEASSLPE